MITWGTMYPVDVIRSVQQSEGVAGKSPFAAALVRPRGLIACARELIAEGGIRRLYRGYGFTILRAGPVAGLGLPVFELLLPKLEGLVASDALA